MNFTTKFLIVLLFLIGYSCQSSKSKAISIFLIDSTFQNSFSDISIINKSTNNIAEKKEDNIFFIYAKPGDQISIAGKKIKESKFYVNDVSSQYSVVLELK